MDGQVIPPPPEKLECAGRHPQLTAPNEPHAAAPLFGCTYSPSYLDSLGDLRRYRDAYVAAFPERAEQLKAIQDRAEARGRTIWSYRLGNVIKADQGVREALWDVDNAFLEVVHAAGLMNMWAQVSRDLELGRRAALASSSVLKGWLASYGLGLGAPEPRLLPTWDPGTSGQRPFWFETLKRLVPGEAPGAYSSLFRAAAIFRSRSVANLPRSRR